MIPDLVSLSSDPERYPRPDDFLPERFDGDKAHAGVSANSNDYMQRDHFAFGFGRRMCPGVHVAEASIFIIVSRILWAFDIRQRPGYPLDMRDSLSKFYVEAFGPDSRD